MPSPIVIHVLRPYSSEDEYLAHERSSITAKTMLLIDQPPLAANTAVVFDVSLTNGQKPIRAEGLVLGYVNAEGAEPGGLRVRFKRFGAATKAFIDRALDSSAATSVSVSSNEAAPSLPEESSGVHRKVARPVAAPPDREALLARLRQRRAG